MNLPSEKLVGVGGHTTVSVEGSTLRSPRIPSAAAMSSIAITSPSFVGELNFSARLTTAVPHLDTQQTRVGVKWGVTQISKINFSKRKSKKKTDPFSLQT